MKRDNQKADDNTIVTDFEKLRTQQNYTGPTKFRSEHGEFADVVAATRHKSEWLACEALSSFYLQRFRTYGKNILPSGTFFQLSWTHQALFYRLMKRFAACAQVGDDRVGVSRQEVVRYMRMAQGKSYNTVAKIIVDAIGAGYVGETTSNVDSRIKVLFLTPISVTDFMFQGFENAHDASAENSLPELWLMLEKQRSQEEDDETVGDVLRNFMDGYVEKK